MGIVTGNASDSRVTFFSPAQASFQPAGLKTQGCDSHVRRHRYRNIHWSSMARAAEVYRIHRQQLLRTEYGLRCSRLAIAVHGSHMPRSGTMASLASNT